MTAFSGQDDRDVLARNRARKIAGKRWKAKRCARPHARSIWERIEEFLAGEANLAVDGFQMFRHHPGIR